MFMTWVSNGLDISFLYGMVIHHGGLPSISPLDAPSRWWAKRSDLILLLFDPDKWLGSWGRGEVGLGPWPDGWMARVMSLEYCWGCQILGFDGCEAHGVDIANPPGLLKCVAFPYQGSSR